MRTVPLYVALVAMAFAGPLVAAPVMMSAQWAKEACEAWNKDPSSPASWWKAAG